MDRPYSISDFALPSRWDSDSGPSVVERAGGSQGDDRVRGLAHRDKQSDNAGFRRFDRSRTIYRGREREYSLRDSEVRTLADVGKFRVVPTEDLARFGYQGDHAHMEADIRNLRKHGLIEQRTIEGHSSYSTRVLALTKEGHGLLRRTQCVFDHQAIYHGLMKPKEARHDAELYRLYQKVAREIERSGGKVRRVILDLELKFVEGPRKIFAHLLTFRPSPQGLAYWMCHEEEIDRRVKGTEYAAMIDRQAPAQRSGVLASLNMIADTLKLLPSEKEATERWSAAKWSEHRKGWLFLTSTPETRKRLIPLTSLWLDTLVLRLMNQGQANPPKVWFVLDELASLQRLPQLHTAITENRKSNNPVVLGFQGRSQLETRYGHEAEAMLSQPATKIFLRTSEPRAAEWISKTVGEVEIERLAESRSSGRAARQRNSKSYSLERHVEPLVMASEISGLADLHGYLKKGNLVVRMHFPFIELPAKQSKYIERPLKTTPKETPQTTAATVEENGTPAQKLTPQEIKNTYDHHLNRAASAQQEHFFE